MNKYKNKRNELKSIRFANRIANDQIKNILSSTGIVCNMIKNGKNVRGLLGTEGAHAQFFNFNRNYYD